MADRPVRLIPGVKPANWVEEKVFSALSERGISRHAELIEHLAEELFRRELAEWGFVAEIGLLGPGVYLSDAQRLTRKLEGKIFVLG